MKNQHFNREQRDMQVKENDAITVSWTSQEVLQKDNFTSGIPHNWLMFEFFFFSRG